MERKMDKNKASSNKKMNFTLFIISVGITAVIFVVLLIVNNKILNPAGKTEVYQAKMNVAQNTIINSKNISYFFEKKEVSKDAVISSPATTASDIENKYLKENILKGEQVSKSILDNQSKRTKNIKDLVEASIKADDISQVVGGTLREGDMVDIILTQSSGQSENHKTISDMKLRNVFISKVFSSDAKEITRQDGNSAATTLNLYMSAQDSVKLDNMTAQGKVKVVKAVDHTGSTNKIEN